MGTVVRTYLLAIGTASIFISLALISLELRAAHDDHPRKPLAFVASEGREDQTSNLQLSRFLQTRVEVQDNAASSKLLPAFPTPPSPSLQCVGQHRGTSGLPRIAMVIPYLHEKWVPMEKTIASILAYTPAELLDEILLIDDGNDPDWQFHDALKALHPKVKVHRNANREGLIKSKVIGADLTTSPVIMFMEPHCIVNKHWLEPLLRQLLTAGPSHSTVVTPTLDIIPEHDFNKYETAAQFIGGFDWSLNFNWMALVAERNKSWKEPEPYPSPAMSGGIFAIWRDFWESHGKYDQAMKEWGSEHVEMSLRVWRCGGRIEMVPCSRIGHLFRSASPYERHANTMFTNSNRVAEVWLESYKEDYYRSVPWVRNVEAGEIAQRLKLKDDLKCKSMDWYIENVYPELKEKSTVWALRHGNVSQVDREVIS